MEITREIAQRILDLVDCGLTNGLGVPKPGKMCIEAVVCYALGQPHGDEPSCVAPSLRRLKIRLNDSRWSSETARAKGLRRLALAQLGSAGALDENEFRRRVVDYAIRKSVPLALRAAASIHPDHRHKATLLDAAARCEKEATQDAALKAKAAAYAADAAAYAAYAAAAYAADAVLAAADAARDKALATYAEDAADAADAAAYAAAADAAARDKALATYAEDIVQILIELKAPGCQWLDLAPLEQAA